MDKIEMREWVCSLEEMLDRKLKKWKKKDRIENGESIRLRWEFEQTDIYLDIFWENDKETIKLNFMSPRIAHDFMWHGLNQKTRSNIEDRIGNLAMSTMYPPINPMD